jgi:hypothetical protein
MPHHAFIELSAANLRAIAGGVDWDAALDAGSRTSDRVLDWAGRTHLGRAFTAATLGSGPGFAALGALYVGTFGNAAEQIATTKANAPTR